MSIDPGLLAKLGVADSDGVHAPFVGVSEFKKLVSLDIECLLNTKRNQSLNDLSGFRHAETSVVAFGIEDFSAKYFENVLDVKDICRAVGRCIQLFEPRLQQVNVDADVAVRSVSGLGLVISAMLIAPGVREVVRFNAMFDIVSKKYAISAQ